MARQNSSPNPNLYQTDLPPPVDFSQLRYACRQKLLGPGGRGPSYNLKIDALTFASAKILTETKMPRMEAMPVIQPMIRVPVFKEQQPQQLDSKGMIGQSENQREMVSEGESVPGLLSRQWKWAPTVSVLCSSFSPQC